MAKPVVHPKLGAQKLVGQGVNLSRTPARYRKPAPDLDADSREILEEFGYTARAIEDLKQRGIV